MVSKAFKHLRDPWSWWDSPPKDEDDYNRRQFYKHIPGLGQYLDAHDNSRRMNDYLLNRGLSWSDIRYNKDFGPSYGSFGATSLTNAMSSVMGLYKSASPLKRRRRRSSSRRRRRLSLRVTDTATASSIPQLRHRSLNSLAPKGGRPPPERALSLVSGLQLDQSYPPKGDSPVLPLRLSSAFVGGVNTSHLSADNSL